LKSALYFTVILTDSFHLLCGINNIYQKFRFVSMNLEQPLIHQPIKTPTMDLNNATLNATCFRFEGGNKKLNLGEIPTCIRPFYIDEADRDRQLVDLTGQMDQLQNRMHAHGRYGIIAIFQAMDAAGKDSSIRHVFKGVNPSRFRVAEFKKPSEKEQAHDYLWRFWQDMPERGYIGIFNRSYYEEVLKAKVHPDTLEETSIPDEFTRDLDTLWKERYSDIVNIEDYLYRNGFPTVKFFLHVNKEEQGERLINRVKSSEKHWKISEDDLKEREYWDKYMKAYEDAINNTSTSRNPWYIIPSDDRLNHHLIIAKIMVELLGALPTEFPTLEKKVAEKFIKTIEKQDKTK
jgi:PPK2 family polyphosphate:nucleotide phosphotransferase